MNRGGIAALCGMAMLAGGAARVEERPALLPQHGALVVYRVTSSAKGAPSEARVAFQAGGERLRVEPGGAPGYVIVDRPAGQVMMVMDQLRAYFVSELDGTLDRALLDPKARFRRLGEDMVAGHPCTVWGMRAPDAAGAGCVTRDGLILRARGANQKGERVTIEAVSVNDAMQPDDLFQVPSDYRRVALPSGAPGVRS